MTIKTTSRKQTRNAAKKGYNRPVLTLYGNIREITKNVGNKSNSDGGTGSNKKSQM